MAISSEQLEWLADFLGRVEDSDQLSEWEGNFVADQATRYKEYGADIRLSVKQWDILFRIASDKLEMPLPDGVEPPPPSRR